MKRSLPARWRLRYNAYYYRVPPGFEAAWDGKKEFRLGSSYAEACQVWADRMAIFDEHNTLDAAFDKFMLRVAPQLKPRTQANYANSIRNLRPVFGAMRPADLQPHHAYAYVEARSAKTSALDEIKVLSAVLSSCVMWGKIQVNPLIGGFDAKRLRLQRARADYITDDQVIAALAIKPFRRRGSVSMCQAYIRIKLLTALRRVDLLQLRIEDLREDGIHVTPQKTANSSGKRLIIEWSPELRDAIDQAKAARSVDISPWLFCTGRGKCYYNPTSGKAHGFDSVWSRFMDRVVTEGKVARFTELALRHKAATDADSLEAAKQLLGHASDATTRRHYRLKPERVKPGRGVR
ncbi:MAG: tyrosine-type recombinase/integrase [Oceanococcaceae bacterium]